MFFQHRRHDVRDRLVLEHAAVHAMGEGGNGGFHPQAVACESAVAAELLRLCDYACHHPLVAIGQQQADFHRLAQQVLQLDVHVCRQAFQFIAIAGRQRLGTGEAMRQQQVGRDGAVVGKAQAQQPCVLGEHRTERREQGRERRIEGR